MYIWVYLVPNWGLRLIRDLRSITPKDLSKFIAALSEGSEISTAWGTAISINLPLGEMVLHYL